MKMETIQTNALTATKCSEVTNEELFVSVVLLLKFNIYQTKNGIWRIK